MIVLLALFNDAPIMAIAYDNVQYSKKREQWHMNTVLEISTILGLIGVISSFTIYFIGVSFLHLGANSPELQTFIFLKLAIAGHLLPDLKIFFGVLPDPVDFYFGQLF